MSRTRAAITRSPAFSVLAERQGEAFYGLYELTFVVRIDTSHQKRESRNPRITLTFQKLLPLLHRLAGCIEVSGNLIQVAYSEEGLSCLFGALVVLVYLFRFLKVGSGRSEIRAGDLEFPDDQAYPCHLQVVLVF